MATTALKDTVWNRISMDVLSTITTPTSANAEKRKLSLVGDSLLLLLRPPSVVVNWTTAPASAFIVSRDLSYFQTRAAPPTQSIQLPVVVVSTKSTLISVSAVLRTIT
jgi:hypothetical protein